jgi:hypothetical protein
MEIIFSLKERLSIQGILPKNGNIIEQVLVKDISEKMVITPQEIEAYKITVNEESIQWQENTPTDKSIELTKEQILLLKNSIDELDEKKEITQDNLDLCLKIKNLVLEE